MHATKGGGRNGATDLVVPLEALPVTVKLLQARRPDLGDPAKSCKFFFFQVSGALVSASEHHSPSVGRDGSRRMNAQVLGAARHFPTLLEAVSRIPVLGLAQHKVLYCRTRISVPAGREREGMLGRGAHR